jgi:hypothetical protein
MSDRPIIVGVDSVAGSVAALFWAADEAVLRGRSLLVVHTPALVRADLVVPVGAAGSRAADDYADRLLTTHATAASARQPGVPVSTLLGHGEAADTLIDLSATAAMVVVGLHSPYALCASVTRRVAAQAHGAVVAIPEGKTFRPSRPGVSVFATGSRADAYAHAVAAEEADMRGVPLTVVDLSLPMRPTADILAIAADRPSLVVVPVARGNDRADVRLDPVVADLLAHAACPVMVLGEQQRPLAAPVPGPGLVPHHRSR